MAQDHVEVSIGKCGCPGTPHPEDFVYLSPIIDMDMGLAAYAAFGESGRLVGDTDGALLSVFIRHGIKAWNLRDEQGPLRITHQSIIARLSWGEGSLAVARKARELYDEAFLGPFLKRDEGSAPPMPGTPATSPNLPSGPSTPTSSGPSSPSEPATIKPLRVIGASPSTRSRSSRNRASA